MNIVTINAGVNNQDNIQNSLDIRGLLKVWLNQGGNNKKYDVIPLCREEIPKSKNNFRDQIGLGRILYLVRIKGKMIQYFQKCL